MNRLRKLQAVAISFLLSLPFMASAAILVPDVGLPGNPNDDAGTIIRVIIMQLLLPIAGTIAVLFIIIGGFQYMFAGADEGLAKRGKSTLQNAILGLIIVILSYVIITVIVNTVTKGVR